MNPGKPTHDETFRRSRILDSISWAIRAQGHNIVGLPHLLGQQILYQLSFLEEGADLLRPLFEQGEAFYRQRSRPWLKPLEISPRPLPALTFSGHLNSVIDCAVSGDGKLAVSAGQDLTVRVWDMASGQMLQVLGVPAALDVPKDPRAIAQYALGRMLTGYSATVRACVLSKDGRYAISAGPGEELAIWNVATGLELCRIRDIKGYVQSCALSRDGGRLIVFVCSDEGIYRCSVYQLPSGQKLQTVEMGENTAQIIGTPDGRLMLGFSPKGEPQITMTPDADRAAATDLLWLNHHDRSGGADTRGRIVALGNRHILIALNQDLQVIDINSGKPGQLLKGHDSLVTCCAVMPDGPLAASAGMDKTARVWDLDQGKEIMRLESDEIFHACAIAPGGDYLLTADGALLTEDFSGRSGVLQLWKIRRSPALDLQKVSRSPVRFLFPLPKAEILLSIRENGSARFHSRDGSQPPAAFRLSTESIDQGVLADDGGKLFYTGKDRALRSVRLDRPGEEGHLTDSHPRLLTVSPNGRWVGALSNRDAVEMWDARTNEKMMSCPCPQIAITRLFFAAHSAQLLIVEERGIRRLTPGDRYAQILLDGESTALEAWQHLDRRSRAEDISARPLAPNRYVERFQNAVIAPDDRHLFTVSHLVPQGDPYAFQFVATDRGIDSARHLDPFPSYALWSAWSLTSRPERLSISARRGDPGLIAVDPQGGGATWVTEDMQRYTLAVFDPLRGGHESGTLEFGSALPVEWAVLPGRFRLVTIEAEGQLSAYALPGLRFENRAYLNVVGLSCALFWERADVIALGYQSGGVEIFQWQNLPHA